MFLTPQQIFIAISIIFSLAYAQVAFPSFSQYVQMFGKNYSSVQYSKRKQIYDKNVLFMKGITDYTPAVNIFTDETEQQRKARKTLKKVDQSFRVARVPPKTYRVGLPTSFDWRDSGVITSIKDQGNCGACWAFVTAAHAESLLIKQGRFNQSIDLSQRYLLKCTTDSDCSGGYLEYSMITGRNLPLQLTYPYTSNTIVNCSIQRLNIAKTSNDYYSLTDSEIISLLLQAPLAIAISSDGWQTYGSGIFKCIQNAPIDHAVLLIGFTPQYWIIKNQWGQKFGMKGFMHITRIRSYNCQIGQAVHLMRGIGDKTNDSYFENMMNNHANSTTNTTTNITNITASNTTVNNTTVNNSTDSNSTNSTNTNTTNDNTTDINSTNTNQTNSSNTNSTTTNTTGTNSTNSNSTVDNQTNANSTSTNSTTTNSTTTNSTITPNTTTPNTTTPNTTTPNITIEPLPTNDTTNSTTLNVNQTTKYETFCSMPQILLIVILILMQLN